MTSDIISKTHDALERLQEFKRTQGPKSTWSAHKRMLEETLFSSARECAQDYARHLFSQTPNSWGMASWGVSVRRDGTSLRLSANGGRSQNGLTIAACPQRMAYYDGLFYQSKHIKPTKSMKARLKSLGLSLTTPKVFTLQNSIGINHEATEKTPAQAYARLACQGEMRTVIQDHTVTNKDLKEAYETGRAVLEDACATPDWTVLPQLWRGVMSHPNLKPLSSKSAKYEPYDAPWRKLEPFALNAVALEHFLVQTLHLAQQVAPAGKKEEYVVFHTLSSTNVKAWSGTSAICAWILENLHAKNFDTLLNSIKTVRTWKVADETGLAARTAFKDAPIEKKRDTDDASSLTNPRDSRLHHLRWRV